MRVRLLLTVVLLAPVLAAAQSDKPMRIPKLFPWDGTVAPATLKFKPAPGVTLGTLRIVFEETQLAAVSRAAGGSILSQGDASEATADLCYTAPGMRIWIVSESADGPVFSLVAIPIGRDSAPEKRCPSLPDKLRPVVFDHGVKLGMSQKDLAEKFGPPSRKRGRTWEYEYQEKSTEKVEGEDIEFVLSNTLEVRFRNGVADAIRVSLNSSS